MSEPTNAVCKNCDEPLTPRNMGVSEVRCRQCEQLIYSLGCDIQAHPDKYPFSVGFKDGTVIRPRDNKETIQ